MCLLKLVTSAHYTYVLTNWATTWKCYKVIKKNNILNQFIVRVKPTNVFWVVLIYIYISLSKKKLQIEIEFSIIMLWVVGVTKLDGEYTIFPAK